MPQKAIFTTNAVSNWSTKSDSNVSSVEIKLDGKNTPVCSKYLNIQKTEVNINAEMKDRKMNCNAKQSILFLFIALGNKYTLNKIFIISMGVI